MNVWTDSDRKWGLESESKSKIEGKHLHHTDISNLVGGNNISHCSLQTLLLWTKYPIFEFYESLDCFGAEMRYRIQIRIESERKHIHHKDISNLVGGNNNSHCYLQTLLLWTKYPIFCVIYESLDWFGPEMRSRIRIKIENWKKTSASYRYIQLSGW